MIAEEAEPVERLQLRLTRRKAGHHGGEILDLLRLVGRRMHRTGAHPAWMGTAATTPR